MTRRTSEAKHALVLRLRDEGLTQAEIAERTGVSQELVSKFERLAGRPRRRSRGRRSFSDSATGYRRDTEKAENDGPGEPQDELELLSLLSAMDDEENAP